MGNIWEFILKYWNELATIFFAGLSSIFAFLTILILFLEYRRDNAKVKVSMNRGIVIPIRNKKGTGV